MQTGTYISGLGHVGLIGWVLFGGAVNPQPLPFEVQQVAVISSAEFAALTAREPVEPALDPVEDVSAPEARLAPAEEASEAPAPEPLPAPEPVPTPEPTPEPEPEPAPDPVPEVAPATQEETTQPEPDAPPQPSPADRIASEAVEAADPDTTPDDITREAVLPEDGEADTVEEPQEATAPEEATTEIVTEAEVPAAAPTRSLRPATRPERPTQAVAQAEETPETDPVSAAVDDAVQAALAATTEATPSATEGGETPRAPSGPPLTSGERDALRVAVSNCWNVGSLSSAALRTTVVVAVSMQEDARPVTSSIRMLSFTGGSESSARQAFEAARRAIIRCGSRGFQLPAEKYAQWAEIEMTFNPENMRIR